MSAPSTPGPSSPTAEVSARPHRMLISYHYARTTDLGAWVRDECTTTPRIFGDSGAYSAWSVGAKIDLGASAEWLHRWCHLFSVYANLDVIGSHEGSARNLARLEASGLRPLPVFHVGEPWELFDDLTAQYSYVALGGAVGISHPKLMSWLIRCYKRRRELGRDDKVVFHGFGMTHLTTIRSFPWYSVDSSSWGLAYRFGRLALFDPETAGFTTVSLGNAREATAAAPLIRRYGGDPARFLSRAKYHASHAVEVSARSYRALETHMFRRHGAVPHLARTDAPGPHVYLADANMERHAVANRALSGVPENLVVKDPAA